jgi:hypothetical protein
MCSSKSPLTSWRGILIPSSGLKSKVKQNASKYAAEVGGPLLATYFLLDSCLGLASFEPEDGGNMFLRNIGGLVPDYMMGVMGWLWKPDIKH